MHPDLRILIFAKAPVPGRVKTRLIPALGEAGACALYRALLRHSVSRVAGAALAPLELWCAPDCGHAELQALASLPGVTLHRQCAGDLGARMAAASADALGRAAGVVLMGVDAPALDPARLGRALALLRGGAEVVLGPAEDGGYVLLGLGRPAPALFSDMPWGSDQVAARTRRRIAESGLGCSELEPLWDLDRPEDLPRLRADFPRLWAQAFPRGPEA